MEERVKREGRTYEKEKRKSMLEFQRIVGVYDLETAWCEDYSDTDPETAEGGEGSCAEGIAYIHFPFTKISHYPFPLYKVTNHIPAKSCTNPP